MLLSNSFNFYSEKRASINVLKVLNAKKSVKKVRIADRTIPRIQT